MTPQQHLKAELDKHEILYNPETNYIDDDWDRVEPAILEAMRAHTNEVLGELEKWINETDELGTGVAGIGDLKAKIQSLKT